MKQIVTLILILLTSNLFGQQSPNNIIEADRTLLIVCHKSYENCGYKAFRISSNIVQIDTCYNIKEKLFSVDKIDSVKVNSLYATVLKLTASEWKQIESSINKINNCDFLAPFEIEFRENNKVETFSINRIMNCYPNDSKKVLEGLDNYFDKMK